MDWCLEHGLVQQGITILQETIISLYVEKFFDRKSIHSLERRELITKALNIKGQKINENEWKVKKVEITQVKGLLNIIDENVAKVYDKLTKARNDINHGGLIEPKSAKKLKRVLQETYDELINLFI